MIGVPGNEGGPLGLALACARLGYTSVRYSLHQRSIDTAEHHNHSPKGQEVEERGGALKKRKKKPTTHPKTH